MQKVILISTIAIILSGCSAIRKTSRSGRGLSGNGKEVLISKNLEDQNISNKGFFIQKAAVSVLSRDMNENFIASIKFSVPDKYLISIRSRTGLEAARIYLSKDTVLVNDRINRKLYYSDPEYIKIKYGLPLSVLPVILGDYIKGSEQVKSEEKCITGLKERESLIKGAKLKYTIDCEKEKIIALTQEGSLNEILVEIKFDDFVKTDNILVPGTIYLSNTRSDLKIKIKIEKMERPWEGEIDFIPGNKYEKTEL